MIGAGKSEANAAFDASFLDVYTGGDKEIRNQVLELFLTQVELLLKRLKDAQGDERAWHEAAHSLKGCASGVGASGLAGLARAAEQEKSASEAASGGHHGRAARGVQLRPPPRCGPCWRLNSLNSDLELSCKYLI